MIISCTTTGVPRITVRYSFASQFRDRTASALGERADSVSDMVSCTTRISAIRKPSATPRSSAKNVIKSVLCRPLSRYFHRSSVIKLWTNFS